MNIVNNDNKCFIWCILAAIFGDSHNDHHNRVSHYREHEQKLNMSGIEMPMQCTERNLAKFERQNDISVSVYGWEDAKMDDNKNVIPGFAYTSQAR